MENMDSAKKIQLPKNKKDDQYLDYDRQLNFQEDAEEPSDSFENSTKPKDNATTPAHRDISAGISALGVKYSNSQLFAKPTAKTNTNWRRVFFITLFSILLAALVGTAFIVWKISAVSQKITITNEPSPSLAKNIQSVVAPIISAEHQPLKGETEGRINILLLGAAGENNPGKNLTDTIMILSINTQTNKIALLSLPRDLYVNIPETKLHTKINSVYQYGLNNNAGTDYIKKTVESITQLTINYFLVLDFEGFTKIVDDVGGINVSVERDIFDSRYPGPNYSYETFEIKKGLHNMDGATALKYVRVRHDDPEGDFGRAKRQQQVIQSTKNKIFSLRTFLNVLTLNKMLNTLEKNLKTDIQLEEIDSFIWWSKQVDSQNINNAVVDAWKKDSLLKVSHVYYGGKPAFILVPRVGNYNEIKDLAENIFDLKKLSERKSEVEKEEAKITLINQSTDRQLAGKVQEVLEENLGFKSVIVKPSPRGTVETTTLVYDRTHGQKIFSLDEIIKKIPARLQAPEDAVNGGQASLASNNSGIIDTMEDSDFVISLGQDLEEIYKYEENTMEELNNAEENQEIILQ